MEESTFHPHAAFQRQLKPAHHNGPSEPQAVGEEEDDGSYETHRRVELLACPSIVTEECIAVCMSSENHRQDVACEGPLIESVESSAAVKLQCRVTNVERTSQDQDVLVQVVNDDGDVCEEESTSAADSTTTSVVKDSGEGL